MTDNCFLCLEKARKNMCPASICKMKCHVKCYRKYIEENETHDGQNIICPVCKSERTNKYNLRKNNNVYKKVNKHEFVKRIKNFLFLVEQYNGTDNKKELVIEMFEFMYYNLWFLRQNERFAIVCKNKLRELYIQDNWNYPNEIHKKFFGTFIR